MKYYAHSTTGPEEEWQGLAEHLNETAELAGRFAAAFNSQIWAYLAGLPHDLGKYTLEFQKRLHGGPRVDHSLAGALEVMTCLKKAGYPSSLGRLMAHIISAHHTGLMDGESLESRLARSDHIPDYSAWASEISLTAPPALPILVKPEPEESRPEWRERTAWALFFWARMIFSCLVDADWLNTEAFLQPDQSARRGAFPPLGELKAAVDAYLLTKTRQAEPTTVNKRRSEVLMACRRAAKLEPGLFSLTVPTGGGKTLSSLAFALDHALAQGMGRIIYVSPYTSIIDQTAAVYREALGQSLAKAVLEHHSGVVENTPTTAAEADDEEDVRLARTLAFENWEAPIIVTTAVQFFESLFAAQKSKCRKVHNIAASVVVLDEAQTLPWPFFRPCLAALKELTASYRVSVVLATATQPEVGAKPWNRGGLAGVREIIEDVPALFRDLDRVKIEFIGTLSLSELAARLMETERVLCIVNTRLQARDLSERLQQAGRRVFHLSTWMCPAHRRKVLAQVKELLLERNGPPFALVSTSLIEAGVDIDFPVVYRALAGLDSIIQAGGRCNREARLISGQVFVFEWPESPRGDLSRRCRAGLAAMQKGWSPLSPEAITFYFNEIGSILGSERLDKKGILQQVAENAESGRFPFQSVARDFRLIEDNGLPLIIPYNEEAEAALDALRRDAGERNLHRRVQQWVVNVPAYSLNELVKVGAAARVGGAGLYYELANKAIYKMGEPALGLDVWNPAFMEAEHLVF